MIDISDAIQAAIDFAGDIALINPDGYNRASPRIEEVELIESENGAQWEITLGWVEPRIKETGSNDLFSVGTRTIEALPRFYKIFVVNADTGKVERMKIRE